MKKGIIFLILLAVAAGALFLFTKEKPASNPGPQGNATAVETAVKGVVERFGRNMDGVYIMADKDSINREMDENYAQFVAPELLAKWKNDPISAPGRTVSSPWPDRTEIKSIEKQFEDTYRVDGEVIEITSVEIEKGGAAAKYPFVATVKNIDGKWLITEFEKGDYTSGDEMTPTNFSEVGTISYNAPGSKPNTPYLVYEKPGQPALKEELKFDMYSIFKDETSSAPIVVFSVSMDVLIGGKRAIVEGVKNDKGVVSVRKISRLAEGDASVAPAPGKVYVLWYRAISLIESCQVKQIMQSHSLDVDLTLKDGKKLRSVEPDIDEVFEVYNRVRAKCGDITLGTE